MTLPEHPMMWEWFGILLVGTGVLILEFKR
jgi:hypothetical protein